MTKKKPPRGGFFLGFRIKIRCVMRNLIRKIMKKIIETRHDEPDKANGHFFFLQFSQ